jgi:hypothetical protein
MTPEAGTSSGSSTAPTWVGWLISGSAIPSAITALVTLSLRNAIATILLILAVLIIIAASLKLPTWMHIAVPIFLAASVAVAGLVVRLDSRFQPNRTAAPPASVSPNISAAPATAHVDGKLMAPKLDDNSPVAGCVPVSFEVALPDSWKLAIANVVDDDTRYYFDSNFTQDPASGQWKTKVYLGDDKHGAGHRFKVYLYAAPATLVDYLTSANISGGTFWRSPKPLPSAVLVTSFDLRRNNEASSGC